MQSVPSLTRAHDTGVPVLRSCFCRLAPQDITVQHLQRVLAAPPQCPRWHAHGQWSVACSTSSLARRMAKMDTVTPGLL